MASSEPHLYAGLLGWSNKRPGLEFYRWDEKIVPRHGSEWGDLLADELDRAHEGCPVVVVVLPRNSNSENVREAATAVLKAIPRPAEVSPRG